MFRHADTTVTLKWIRVAAVAVLSAAALPSPAFGAKKAEMVLVCTNLVSGTSWQIRIDFDARTVDSNPAQISTREISWRDAADRGNYTLDRKSGSLTVVFASSTGGYFMHHHCTLPD
jgi:hypothetical protein